MLTVLMYENTLEQLENLGERDVLIQPDLPGISSVSFEKGREGIEFGAEAARAMAEELSRLAVPAARFADYPRASGRRAEDASGDRRGALRQPVEARNEGDPAQDRGARGRAPGRGAVAARARHLYGEGIFDSVTFSLDEVEGRNELVIHTLPKEQGSHFLRFGLNLETNFTSESDFNLAMLATSTPMNKLGAEWRNRFQVGQESEFKTEFFQPLESGRRLFVAPVFRIGIESADLFVDGDRIATYERPSIEAAASWAGSSATGERCARGSATSPASSISGWATRLCPRSSSTEAARARAPHDRHAGQRALSAQGRLVARPCKLPGRFAGSRGILCDERHRAGLSP